jgi:D-alanyl-D-alanine dipeptidase
MLTFSDIENNQQIPANFIYLQEIIPDIVYDLRYFSEENFIGAFIPGYEADLLIITLEAAMALKCVQQELKYSGLALKVFDAYRPQRAVDFFKKWAHNPSDLCKKSTYYPNLDKQDIFPLGYLLELSTHSRGSTVDLTIINLSDGTELDMGTVFDFFDILSATASLGINAQQRANRLLLRTVMQKHGFVAVEEEWWHFTLKNEPYPNTWFDFVIK